jgi:segregation and condensation protein B
MDRDEYHATGGGAAVATADIRESLLLEEVADTPGDVGVGGSDELLTSAPPDEALLAVVLAHATRDAAQPAQIIEALLFSADTPLSAARLGELAGVGSITQVRLLICDLNDKYKAAGLSFRIEEIARGYQMLTLPTFQPWVARLNKAQAQTRLSAAALETLSIVAYKQPVIRAEIEAIRGVAGSEVLNRLREMGLVKIVGRADMVGRPLLYGTTRKFLDVLGLADLDDLPPIESLALRQPEARPAKTVDPAGDLQREIPVAIGA